MKIKRKRIFKSDICVDANGDLYIPVINHRKERINVYLEDKVYDTFTYRSKFDTIDGLFKGYTLAFVTTRSKTFINKHLLPNHEQ